MADLTYTINVRMDKDYLSNSIAANGVTATMALAGMKSVTYTLTTSVTSISTANINVVGLGFFRNLSTDTASTVQIGVSSGTSFASFSTLRAGEPAVLRLSTGREYQAIGVAGSRLRVDVTEG